VLTITSKGPYAVSALTELALQAGSGPVPIGEIARRRGIPAQFLEGIFARLRRVGILQSQRGVGGGYLFARPPAEITALEVVEQLDGELEIPAAELWGQAIEAVRGVLGGVTIAELAEREARSGAMYYI